MNAPAKKKAKIRQPSNANNLSIADAGTDGILAGVATPSPVETAVAVVTAHPVAASLHGREDAAATGARTRL
jgi:hypothetical protein